MQTQARVLHQSPWQGVLHITGGGASLLTDMLSTPGASATVLEAKVPYAGAALADLLGRCRGQGRTCAQQTGNSRRKLMFQRAEHCC